MKTVATPILVCEECGKDASQGWVEREICICNDCFFAMDPREQGRRTGFTQGGFEVKPEDFPALAKALEVLNLLPGSKPFPPL